ncbi:MAG: arginine--tRNA ligase [Lachnospiraceae bacterium]|nr:arginine--tRNA ligase [Lachnospiraceae bacterium]
MKKFLDILSEEVGKAFEAGGYRRELGKVSVSNRPDLCEYQCNGAMAGAKEYKKPPFVIANEVAEVLKGNTAFEKIEVVNPGFLNLNVSGEFLKNYLIEEKNSEKFGLEALQKADTIMIDYGGPNVAKPLHVGHLRSAVIGESIKRIARFRGHNVIGDIHLGDWGLQMGLIIAELKLRKPELPYFDEQFEGEYPAEAPFTISELEEIYPAASAKSKVDASFKEEAMACTFKLQSGVRGYRALWKHILSVSVADLKQNYEKLNVSFDLWKGESDVHDVIPGMVEYLKNEGYAHLSDGALVVDVKEDSDTKEIPPCMILKSDGASLYNTTDLATIMERTKEYDPDQIIYVVDKRQDLYFEQVFRCARKTGLAKENTKLTFVGFGTMNGKDGKPFKTREGGVMRLEHLIRDINEEMLKKIMSGRDMTKEEAEKISRMVALSALKYGDLSNQASKDYIFDIDRFTSFEGDTGPYLLYTVVRIKSILKKYEAEGKNINDTEIGVYSNSSEKKLMMELTGFNAMVETAYDEIAPHKICAYLYSLANAFNSFYHETKILSQEDEQKKKQYIALLQLTKEIAETCMDMLGFSAPEKM